MLPSPQDVVVGSSDLDATAAFLAVFGFAPIGTATLPAPAARALYGLDGAAEERLHAVPGTELGRIRCVATPNPPRRHAPFDARPFAIDLFCTDVEESVRRATAAGHHASPITDHRFGPVLIREVEIVGPDHLVVTLLQPSAGRRSSILDREPERLHSEVHAFVWSATDLDGRLEYFKQRGLALLTDAVLDTPGMGALVGVPDEDVRMRLTVLADTEGRPIRLEYVDFLGKPGASGPTLPLAAGLHAPAFEVASLDEAVAAVAPAELGEIVAVDTALHPTARAVSAVTPGGERFELWQQG